MAATKLLLAEDDPVARTAQSRLLQALGYDVVAVEDGEAAVSYLMNSDNHVDLLVTDYDMPKRNGIEVLEYCRWSSQWARLPVIMVSGVITDDQMRKRLNHSLVTFLSKPVDVVVLKQAIERLVQLQRKISGEWTFPS
jgi:CheY-like chemotaxis protein